MHLPHLVELQRIGRGVELALLQCTCALNNPVYVAPRAAGWHIKVNRHFRAKIPYSHNFFMPMLLLTLLAVVRDLDAVMSQ